MVWMIRDSWNLELMMYLRFEKRRRDFGKFCIWIFVYLLVFN